MKKLFALLAIALFVMPVVFAVENNESTRPNKGTSIREYIRERLRERNANREDVDKIREAAKERFEKTRERYEKAKQRYLKAEEMYKNAKEKYEQARKVWMKVRNERNETKRLEMAKEYVGRAAEVMITYIEKIKDRVANSELDNETKNELMANLDTHEQRINELLEKVDNATSIQEVREYAKQLRETWRDAKFELKRVVGLYTAKRMERFIEKAEKARDRLEKWLDNLESRGYNTSSLKGRLSEIDMHIREARNLYEQAKEAYMTGTREGEMFPTANRLLRDAHKHLIEAYKIMRSIIKDGKEMVRKSMEAGNTGETEQEAGENETIEGNETEHNTTLSENPSPEKHNQTTNETEDQEMEGTESELNATSNQTAG